MKLTFRIELTQEVETEDLDQILFAEGDYIKDLTLSYREATAKQGELIILDSDNQNQQLWPRI